MDLEELFKARMEITSIHLPSVAYSFQLDGNKLYLTRIVYRQLSSTSNQTYFNKVAKLVGDYVDFWINNDKLKKIEETANFSSSDINSQLSFYNSIFVSDFISRFTKNDMVSYETFNNPYKQIIEKDGRNIKIKDMLSEDYENINTNMMNYNDIYNVNEYRMVNRNKIKFYEISLYKKNIDKTEQGSLENNVSKSTTNYKKYNDFDLKNNVSYLRKNKKNN